MTSQLERIITSQPHWKLSKEATKKVGYITAALLTDLYVRYTDNGFKEFHISSKEIESELQIGKDQRRSSLNKLTDIGVLTIVKKGVPARNFYAFDKTKTIALLLGKEI